MHQVIKLSSIGSIKHDFGFAWRTIQLNQSCSRVYATACILFNLLSPSIVINIVIFLILFNGFNGFINLVKRFLMTQFINTVLCFLNCFVICLVCKAYILSELVPYPVFSEALHFLSQALLALPVVSGFQDQQ